MDRCPKCGWHHTDECMGENMAADHNPAIPRTRTPILISAMRLLARDIESEDGVANAAIAEAGNRLADLEEELERSNKFLEDARAAFKAKVDVLEADLDRYRKMVSPANAIDLGEFIGPVKPCPFCGSVALERDGFEEHIVCGNCGASAPVGGWQFRVLQS